MKKKVRKALQSAFAGLLAAAMLITSSGLESVVAYAAEDSSVSESESSETMRTVTLGNFENGTLAFSDSNKSSKDYAVGETVTVYATPADGYTLSNVALLDESDNPYSCTRTVNTITFKVPEYDVKLYAYFTESDEETESYAEKHHLDSIPEGVTEEQWIQFWDDVELLDSSNSGFVNSLDLDSEYVDLDGDIEEDEVRQCYVVDEDGNGYAAYDVEGSDYYIVPIVDDGTLEETTDALDAADYAEVDENQSIAYVEKDSVDVYVDTMDYEDGEGSSYGETGIVSTTSALYAGAGPCTTSQRKSLTATLKSCGTKTIWIQTLQGSVDFPEYLDAAFCIDPGYHSSKSSGASYTCTGEFSTSDSVYSNGLGHTISGSDVYKAARFYYWNLDQGYLNSEESFRTYFVATQIYMWNLASGGSNSDLFSDLSNAYRALYGTSMSDTSIEVIYLQLVGDVWQTAAAGYSFSMWLWETTASPDSFQRLFTFDGSYNPVTTSPNELTIKKYSSDEWTSATNSNYSLAGAKFKITCSSAWDGETYQADGVTPVYEQVTYEVTIGSDGIGEVELEYEGTWDITEVEAPQGFSLPNWTTEYYTFTQFETYFNSDGSLIVNDGEAVCYVYDPVKYGSLKISKSSTNTNISGGNSNYSLQGAYYKIVCNDDSAGKQVFYRYTDANGEIYLPDIPLGTYTITEIDSSAGYEIWEGSYSITLGWNGDNSSNYTTQSVSEVPQRRPVNIVIEKYDQEQRVYESSSNPQGDATLLGTVFHFEFYEETTLTRSQIESGQGTNNQRQRFYKAAAVLLLESGPGKG